MRDGRGRLQGMDTEPAVLVARIRSDLASLAVLARTAECPRVRTHAARTHARYAARFAAVPRVGMSPSDIRALRAIARAIAP